MRNESLSILLELAKQRVAQMSDDEYEAMLAEQRLSWVRGEMDISAAERAAPPASPTQGASQTTDALKSAEKALRPFYNAVFNDNGDITVDGRYDYDEAVAGYFAYKKIERALVAIGAGRQAQVTDAVVEAVLSWVCDDVLPAYDIPSDVPRNDPELPESCRAALTAAIGAGGQAVAFSAVRADLLAGYGKLDAENALFERQIAELLAEIDRLTISRDGYIKDSHARAAECDRLQAENARLSLPLKDEVERVLETLSPLVAIADAYDENALDDEARRWWGRDDDRKYNDHDPDSIELYTGRGGRCLLTLGDCLRARRMLALYRHAAR